MSGSPSKTTAPPHLLTIDVGNTHITFGVYQGPHIIHDFRLSTDHHRTADEYRVLVKALLLEGGVDADDVTDVALASVVPEAGRALIGLSLTLFGVQPLVIGPGVKTGMPILVDNPREVGADRIVNGVAAYERCKPGQGVIVVDFGTATTFDVVTPRGEYVGGAIAPGVAISTEALFLHAAKLPRVAIEKPESVIGRNTSQSMKSGIFFGYVALVDGMIERIRQEVDFAPATIATGGLAAAIATSSQAVTEVDENLTLDGLRLIHERNRASTQ